MEKPPEKYKCKSQEDSTLLTQREHYQRQKVTNIRENVGGVRINIVIAENRMELPEKKKTGPKVELLYMIQQSLLYEFMPKD